MATSNTRHSPDRHPGRVKTLPVGALPMLHRYWLNVATWTKRNNNYRDFRTKQMVILDKDTVFTKNACRNDGYPKYVVYREKKSSPNRPNDMKLVGACEVSKADLLQVNQPYFADLPEGSEASRKSNYLARYSFFRLVNRYFYCLICILLLRL